MNGRAHLLTRSTLLLLNCVPIYMSAEERRLCLGVTSLESRVTVPCPGTRLFKYGDPYRIMRNVHTTNIYICRRIELRFLM